MSFVARDIFEAGSPQLQNNDPTTIPSGLVRHIVRRLLDSFAGPGVVPRWLDMTRDLDHDTFFRGDGLYRQSFNECAAIKADVDAGILSPIGLILADSFAPWAVFDNHVVLVWGYEVDGDMLTLRTYDCNRPGQDDIFIRLDVSSPAPAKKISTNGSHIKDTPGVIRGFFRLPYSFVDPAPCYIDDAEIRLENADLRQVPAGLAGEVAILVRNTGSTTWRTGAGYRIGTQTPQDNVTWGSNRAELPGDVAPGSSARCVFPIKAPLGAGRYVFCAQMLREAIHWFGNPTAQLPFTVGGIDGVCTHLHDQHDQLASQLADIMAEMASIDRSDHFAARAESRAIGIRARQVRALLVKLEKEQAQNGCAPG